jgi:hypothetical protein
MPADEIHESEGDQKNDEWFKDNYIDLLQDHPREWIAVIDQKIIATASNETDLEVAANKVAGDKEYSVYFIAQTGQVTDVEYAPQENP